MNMNVTFELNDMSFQPEFGSVIPMGGDGASVVFVPDVSEDGVLSWKNNGGLPNPNPVNIKGKDGAPGKDGLDGEPGVDGKDGQPGADGYTPVKGKDYYTEADKDEMVDEVAGRITPERIGAVTEEMLAKRLADYATLEDVVRVIDDEDVWESKTWSSQKIMEYVDEIIADCVGEGEMESVLTDHMEFITQGVIASLPIYDGEVVE